MTPPTPKYSTRVARAEDVAQWVESLSTGSKAQSRFATLLECTEELDAKKDVKDLTLWKLPVSQPVCPQSSSTDTVPHSRPLSTLPHLQSLFLPKALKIAECVLSHAHILHEVEKLEVCKKMPEALFPFLGKEELK